MLQQLNQRRASQRRSASTSRRGAFSLLEVILAVGLTAIVVYLIAGAIDFHLRQLTVRRSQIEQAQLARAVLRRMADDLRAAIVYRPIDFSAAEKLVAASEELEELAEGETGEEDAEQETSATDDLVDSATAPTVPGVYGSSFELQIDISRMPRYEEYAFAGDFALESSTLLSDLKTVSYFLLGNTGGSTSLAGSGVDPSMLDTLGMSPQQASQGSGLARRVVARSAARFAAETGSYGALDNQVELLAPEVAMMEFRYFDGQTWLNEWDTEESGGIPLAVEITIVLHPEQDRSSLSASGANPLAMSGSLGGSFDMNDYYRLVVNLPPAEPIPEEEATDSSAESSEDGA